ncbi:hypothetical protein AVEN_66373-1, partial [Araneus ventricosus]
MFGFSDGKVGALRSESEEVLGFRLVSYIL